MRKFRVLLWGILFSTMYAAAQHTLTGIVLDEAGLPLPGVSIRMIGHEQNGSITDNKGAFSINVTENKVYKLKASFIGYIEQTFQAQPKVPVKLRLQVNSVSLDEMVVVGYTKVKKSHLTGAVSSLKGDEVLKTTTTDAATALQGKIAGVVIERNSGKPGAGVSVKVRGVGTLGSTTPLYVVDGIYSSSLMLSPEEIESIEVLKDASAAAIYGAQAANGVVLVTSKKGKKGLPKVEYSGTFGIQKADGLPKMADGKEYAKYWYTAFKNEGQLDDYPSQILPDSVGAGTDWYKEVYSPAPFYRQNVRVSGGGDYMNASMSINHSDQEGTFINTGYKEYGASINTNYDRNRWHFGNTLRVKQSDNRGIYDAGQLSTLTYSPLAVRANADGTYDDGLYDYQMGFDPVYYAKNFSKKWVNRNMNSLFFAAFDLMKGLTLKTNFNYNFGLSEYVQQDKSLKIPGRADPSVSCRIESHNKSYSTRSELLLNYNGTFGLHSINSVAGISRGQYNSDGLWIRADDLIDDDLPVLSSSDGTMQVSPSISKGGDLGYFGQLNYAYANRYLLGASVRRDGSSKFSSNNRYGTFPSVSLGWNIGKEKFFKLKYVDDLKLRGSWGQLGNSSIGEYMYESSVDIVSQRYNYVIGTDQHLWTGGAQSSYTSPGVSWETSTTWNVGLDLSMFNDKVDATAEVYQRKTTGALVTVPLPKYTGSLSDPAQNVGSLRNQGFELSATYREYSKKLKYSFSGNISFIQDKVLALSTSGTGTPIYGGYVGNLSNGVNVTTVGRSIAEFYLIKTDGIFRTQEELDAHTYTNPETGTTTAIQPKAQLGDVRYVDYNNDGVISDADKQFCGKSSPDFYYSTTAHFEYGSFDLDLFFNGQYGNKIFNYSSRESLAPQTTWANMQSGLLANSWSPENPDAKYPRVSLTDPNGNGDVFTDRWLEDGSFFRLQNIQLGYSLPKVLISKINVSNVRLYLNTTNVFTITRYSLGNPEIGNEQYVSEEYSVLRRGVNSWQYPMFRTFSTGVQIVF
ncbi:MAG: TonB-dependent receptor [Bacteroidota bacterium]|nr:TonB-dependent receptor [Bacteroidota bacterium]